MIVPRHNFAKPLIAAGVCIVIGMLLGGMITNNNDQDAIIERVMQRDARDLSDLIASLKQLQNGANQAAMLQLERLINDRIIALDTSPQYPDLSEHIQDTIKEAIAEAYNYQQAHPRAQELPGDALVESVFNRHGLIPSAP